MIKKLNENINLICSRLDRIEQKLEKQTTRIDNAEEFATETAASMARLSEILVKLETRTRNNIQPRRLEHDYESHTPAKKRQDTKGTPTKGYRS